MRLLAFICLFGALISGSDAMACRQLVRFDAHLSGDAPRWFEDYRLAQIVEVHPDHLVVNIKRRFDGYATLPRALVLQFIPNQGAYAVCPTQFDVGKTYLVHIRADGAHEQISRYDGYDIPASHANYPGYVQDLERAMTGPGDR